MTYLGIDLHTRNMTICAVSSNGKKIGEWKLTNNTYQLDNLIREIGGSVKAVVEATSSWSILAEISHGLKVISILPVTTDWFREQLIVGASLAISLATRMVTSI